MGQHWHQLTHTDRLRIEANLNVGRTPRHIADMLHVHISTIYREIKRGRYTHMNSDLTTDDRYSPDIAQRRCDENMAAKGAPLKIGNDFALAAYIEDRIVNGRYSPCAVLGEIAAQGLTFSVTICPTTLYSYIEKGVFLHLSNRDLPVKGSRKRKYNQVQRAARAPKGESIEHRPESINNRSMFGHWEMDCVEGKKSTKRTMLALTERKTRHNLMIPIACNDPGPLASINQCFPLLIASKSTPCSLPHATLTDQPCDSSQFLRTSLTASSSNELVIGTVAFFAGTCISVG